MVQCKNLLKRYNDRTVLSEITFKAPAAKVTGLIGPNGSGKTTLIKILTGFEQPDSGEIHKRPAADDRPGKGRMKRRSCRNGGPSPPSLAPDPRRRGRSAPFFFVQEGIRRRRMNG